MISEVYNCDCMEYMKSLPDRFFELAIVDPPYGIGAEIGTNAQTKKKFKNRKCDKWDSDIPGQGYFNELTRVSKRQIIWGADYFLERNLDIKSWLIWDKGLRFLCFGDCEMASVSSGFDGRRNQKRIFTYNPTTHGNRLNKIHPTQKPIALYKWLLENYAKKGYKIFDSHMGSQSSRIAAYDLGFDFYGCELDKDYFQQGCERFENHKLKREEIKQFGYAKTELSKINQTLF